MSSKENSTPAITGHISIKLQEEKLRFNQHANVNSELRLK